MTMYSVGSTDPGPKWTFHLPRDGLFAAMMSAPDRDLIALVSDDLAEGAVDRSGLMHNWKLVPGSRAIRIFDTRSGELRKHISGLEEAFHPLRFASGGRLLANDEGEVLILNAETGAVADRVLTEARGVIDADFVPGTDRLAILCVDQSLVLHDLARDEVVWRTIVHESKPTALAVSPDGRTIVTGGTEGWIRFWDAEAGFKLHEARSPDDGHVLGLAFDRAGDRLIAATSQHFLIFHTRPEQAASAPTRGWPADDTSSAEGS